MIQLKYMLAVFQKRPFYYNIPSKHAQEKCLNVDFLTGVQGVQKKCMFEVESSSKNDLDIHRCLESIFSCLQTDNLKGI